MPDNGNEWGKFRVVPRSHPSRPLFAFCCFIRVETEGLLDYQGRAGSAIVRWILRPFIFGVEKWFPTAHARKGLLFISSKPKGPGEYLLLLPASLFTADFSPFCPPPPLALPRVSEKNFSNQKILLGKGKRTPPCSSEELFFAEKKWRPQRKDFGARYGSPGSYRVFYPPPAWKVFL